MAEYQHLPLIRADVNLERRKHGGGRPINRDTRQHGTRISREIANALAEVRTPRIVGIDPSLILKLIPAPGGYIDPASLSAAGLTVVGTDADKTLIVFGNDAELTQFRQRIEAYIQGPRPGAKSAPYQQFVSSIESVGHITPQDRIGRTLKDRGFDSPASFLENQTYVLDVELWDIGAGENAKRAVIAQIEQFLIESGGTITDSYVSSSLTLIRIQAEGWVVRRLLELSEITSVDAPPTRDDELPGLLNLTVADFAETPRPDGAAPAVAILDSGLAGEHPLLGPAVAGAIGVPDRLGAADMTGHGTAVAGLALYGDIRAPAERREFVPTLRLVSARVVNDTGGFDELMLVPSQMREAITRLHREFGCRVFNISLGDVSRIFRDGSKVGPWAACLDELVRALDVIIVVSTGNFTHKIHGAATADSHLTDYPHYLLADNARLIEPATAALCLSVGSLSHTASGPTEDYFGPGVRPIAQINEPSPFTRCGPGIGGMIKPDFCDYGGNRMFDGGMQRVSGDFDACNIMSMNREFIRNLFVMRVAGTSYAAPRVAHKAAVLLRSFPNASNNLIRALLCCSADVPAEASEKMSNCSEEAVSRACGWGLPELERAHWSDDQRVVMFDDASLDHDRFFIYEIPIPNEFSTSKGDRRVRVSLAYDPPTRHSRADYLGVQMGFRMVRGETIQGITEHFRRRATEEGPPPNMGGNCEFFPGPRKRETSTLQQGTFVMKRNPREEYGDTYYLIIYCRSKWAPATDSPQRFAVAVELWHPAVQTLYAQVNARVQQRMRARQRI